MIVQHYYVEPTPILGLFKAPFFRFQSVNEGAKWGLRGFSPPIYRSRLPPQWKILDPPLITIHTKLILISVIHIEVENEKLREIISHNPTG